MAQVTLTEALAELKTLEKRIESKRAAILPFLVRQERMKDPLLKEGGSAEYIKRERQAINDLQERIVRIRSRILEANFKTVITIGNMSRSIQDWLTWRREVSAAQASLLRDIVKTVTAARASAQSKGVAIVPTGEKAVNDSDLIVNVDDASMAKEIEGLEQILGTLDGQLSLKNATVVIDVD